MRALALGWLAGTLALQWQPSLPDRYWSLCLFFTGLLCLGGVLAISGSSLIARSTQRASPRLPSYLNSYLPLRVGAIFLCALISGFGWSACLAIQRMAQALPVELEGRDLQITGVVASLPDAVERGWRFQFEVEQALDQGQVVTVPRLLMLGRYSAPSKSSFLSGPSSSSEPSSPAYQAESEPELQLQPGQRWQWTVRLKRAHGLANPDGFDTEAWLLSEGILATGYVRNDDERLLQPFVRSMRDAIGLARSTLRQRIHDLLPQAPYAGVIVALVVGDQRSIESSDWEIFNRTGVGHLVSISGLHITMIAALCAACASWLWRHVGSAALPLRLPAQKVALACAWLAALAYVALAGFGIPAQRTLLMLACVVICLWSHQRLAASIVLSSALWAVIVLDPWAVLWPGFWLSFSAIACILWVCDGRAYETVAADRSLARLRRSLWAAGRSQWAVTLGLLPLSVLLFGQVSLIGPLANALAIPLVSLVVTPLALVGSLAPAPFAGYLLLLAHASLEGLVGLLSILSSWPGAVWQMARPDSLSLALGLVGLAWLLAPKGWPMRWAGLLAWLPMLMTPTQAPEQGLWLTAFDIGQGNAVLIETAQHRLLYDTGPAFSKDSDSGQRVLLPYLRARGIDRLDGLMISHSDNDHVGGAQSVLSQLPVAWISSSLADSHPLLQAYPQHVRCMAGQHWEWDGVEFEVLHPRNSDYPSNQPNALSCTLRIRYRDQVVLLAGDIESPQERALLERAADRLEARVLLAPHHGSGTSSTAEFLDAVRPQWAVFQVGYRNRYRHPKQTVLERYRERGIFIQRTDEVGAVMMQINESLSVSQQRCQQRRYWQTRVCDSE